MYGCDSPGSCQMSRIPGKLGLQLGACMKFVRGCSLWGRVCPSPSGSDCCPPASLPLAGDGPFCSWLALLWYLLSPSFCDRASSALGQSFSGESSLSLSFFFSLSLAISQFELLSHVSAFRLPSGHSGSVLTLSNVAHVSLFSPRLLVANVNIQATLLLGVAVRHVICGFYLFIFFLPVMLPSEIPKLPTDPLVRGFPGVWKLLFYDSLPGTSPSPSPTLLSLFLSFIFCPTSF